MQYHVLMVKIHSISSLVNVYKAIQNWEKRSQLRLWIMIVIKKTVVLCFGQIAHLKQKHDGFYDG